MPCNNYVTLSGGGGVRDAIRSVVKVSVKKGEGGNNRKKKLLLNFFFSILLLKY